jgi:hypothetical protein
MMTRKHFREIAHILKEAYETNKEHIVYAHECNIYPLICRSLEGFFTLENPNFDGLKFMQECGYEDYQRRKLQITIHDRGSVQYALTQVVRYLYLLTQSTRQVYEILRHLSHPYFRCVGFRDVRTGEHAPCNSRERECDYPCEAFAQVATDVADFAVAVDYGVVLFDLSAKEG